MARGRKKDLSIPPSRALTQQRDYRARKAQYVADLEERCQRAEEENVRLREEIETLKAQCRVSGITTTCNPELVKVTSELMQQVTSTSASLARFRQLVAPQASSEGQAVVPSMSIAGLPSTSFPFPLTPPAGTPHALASEVLSALPVPNIQIPSAAEAPPVDAREDEANVNGWQSNARERSRSPWEECCGGLMDCRGLIEEDDEADTSSFSNGTSSLRKTSELRSTSRDMAMVGVEMNEEDESSGSRTRN